VDEGLSGLKEEIDISIIYNEEKGVEYELPSYEIIGDIAVISELTVDEEEAVDGILDHHPHVKTILLKKGGLKGEFRVGDYEKLHGEETETVHKEFGCEFKVDPTKAYFSERFSTERDRVVSQIEEGEKVLVMFAGVGPFAIMAAKNASPETVVGVEKNPEACDYMKENIKLNNAENTAEAFCGDVSEIDYKEEFDRIVMPLPGSADEFLGLAMELVEDYAVIHYYRFLEDGDWGELEEEIEQISGDRGLEYEILDKVKCGERGPTVDRVCIDIKILR
jgi:tRNA (guanine37-N1)-methyltransferase